MKKSLFLTGTLLFSASMYSQIGINNAEPKATLVVATKTTNGTSAEGLLAPRLTGELLHTADLNGVYKSVQYGTLAFVTSPPSIANQIGQTVDIDTRGYYYYDFPKNKWVKVAGGTRTGTITSLNCANIVASGTLYGGQPTNGVTITVPYTGGNGGSYQAGVFSSTGVTGLLAVLVGSTLDSGTGNLVFNITGTPSTAGTASFAVVVGGQSCSFTVPVNTLTASVGSLICASVAFSPAVITQGTAYIGTLIVPYTGGNGGSYAQQSFTNNGLTFTLSAGTLSNVNGNLLYTVTGTPANAGGMNVPITFGGQSCAVNAEVASPFPIVVLPGNSKAWMRHNLGADYNLDPDIPVKEIHGNYYQWGRAAIVADADTPSGAISGWNSTEAPNNSWADDSKTANDPCPAGFRVPTQVQWKNLINNNTAGDVGPFTNSPANFGSAKVFGIGSTTLTFPISGSRLYTNGTLNGRGSDGYYWGSTPLTTGTYAYTIHFYSNVDDSTYRRTSGHSIRCISE